MSTYGVDSDSLQADSQPKLVGLFWESPGTKTSLHSLHKQTDDAMITTLANIDMDIIFGDPAGVTVQQ